MSDDPEYRKESFMLIGGVGNAKENSERDAGYELICDEAKKVKTAAPYAWNWSKISAQGK